MRKIARLSIATLAVFAAGHVAMAKTVHFKGVFSSEAEAAAPVPAGAVVPSGTFRATLNTVSDSLSYHITYAGLSGPVQAAHFHGPAAPGVSAGVLVPIPGPYHSGMAGTVKVPVSDVAILEAGKAYVNLHTAAHPDGEARAQVNPE